MRLGRNYREIFVVLRRRRSNHSPLGSPHPGYLNNHADSWLRSTRKRESGLELSSASSRFVLFGLVLRSPWAPKVWGEPPLPAPFTCDRPPAHHATNIARMVFGATPKDSAPS